MSIMDTRPMDQVPALPAPRASRSNAGRQSAARTTRGCGRAHNEDAVLVAGPLLAVSDGVGGGPGGELASAAALRGLASALIAWTPGAEPAAALRRGFSAANAEVRVTAHATGTEGTAATLVAALLGPASVTVAHAGDSRAYLVRDGCLRRLTVDHRIGEEVARRDRLGLAPLDGHWPPPNAITRAAGLGPVIDPDLARVRTRPGDRLLLCSDGLTDALDDAVIAALIEVEPDLRRLVDRLIAAAQAAGARDDITVLVAAR